MRMIKILAPLVGAMALACMSAPAAAQCSGVPGANTICAGPPSGSPGQFRARPLVPADLLIGSAVQAWDADLDALAALTGTNTIYYRSGANTWAAVSIGGLLSFSGGTINVADAELVALAGLTSAADKVPYFTGAGTAAVADFTALARTLLGNSAASGMRSTLGLVIGTDVQAYHVNLAAYAGLTGAAGKVGYFTAAGTMALFDSTTFGRSVSNVADASALRTLAGAVIGTNVQAWDADLDALAALSGTNTIYYRSGANTWAGVTVGGLLSFSGGTLNVGDAELVALAGLISAADKCAYFTGAGTAAVMDCLSWSRSVTSAATVAAGRTAFGLAIGTDVQAYHVNLAAYAGLTGAAGKIGYFTAAGTMALFDSTMFGRSVSNVADASALRTLAGAVIGTNVQAWDTDLDCIAAISANGIISRTGAGTCNTRTITAPAAGFTVANGDGVSGNPTFSLANDLAALEALSGTGIARRTGTDAWSVGTLVANSELADMATARFKGRTTAGTGAPEDLTATQATAMLNAMVGDSGSGGTKGLVPASGAGDAAAGKYLKADGTFAVPPGTGGGGALSDADRQNILLESIYQAKLFGGYRRQILRFSDGYKASDGVNSGSSSGHTVDTSGGRVYSASASTSSATPGGTTGGSSFTQIDRTNALPNNATVISIGAYSVSAISINLKLVKRNSTGNYDIIYSQAASHPGGGWVDFTLTTPQAIPGSGTYYTGFYSASARNLISAATPRAYVNSDVTGTSQALSEDSATDGTGGTRATTITNMVLVTTSQTSDATVTNGRVLIEFDNTASPALNTDLTAEVTCNGGTNWATASLSAVSSYSQGGRKVAESVDQACGASGTSFAARIKTLNNKGVPVHGLSLAVH